MSNIAELLDRSSGPQISPRITVSGHVYDTATGLVETVGAAAHPGA